MKIKKINVVLSVGCLAVMLLLIYFRAGIESWFAFKFDTYKEFSANKYPTSFQKLTQLFNYQYKWAFTLTFTLLFTLASLGCIWLLFPFRSVFRSLILLYFVIAVLLIFFSLVSLITHDYQLGFGVVRYLKNMLHTGYLTFFLLLYFWKINNPYLMIERNS